MRQLLSKKKTRKIAEATGLDIEKIMVRGNTDHRKDLCLTDGTIAYLFRNGALVKSQDRWSIP